MKDQVLEAFLGFRLPCDSTLWVNQVTWKAASDSTSLRLGSLRVITVWSRPHDLVTSERF